MSEEQVLEQQTETKPAESETKPVENETTEQQTETKSTDDETKPVEGDEKAEGVETKEEPEHKPEGGRWQKRVNRLTKEVYELRSQLSAAQQPPVVKPERSQFATDEQYNEALIDYKVEQRIPQVQKRIESGSIEQQFQVKEEALRNEVEDYDDVIADHIKFPHQSTIDAIVTSDYGPRIRYYLGTHPEETEALLGMNAASASRQIGKIEAKIEAELQAKKDGASAGKPVSQAKPPIKPVKTSGSTAKIDPNKLSDNDWFKLEQQKKRERFKQT